jgi:hypothetical protein
MKKTLIAAVVALAGAAAVPGTANAGTIVCDTFERVQDRLGVTQTHCVDDPNPVDDAIKDVLALIELD